jgi:hypothetical protein
MLACIEGHLGSGGLGASLVLWGFIGCRGFDVDMVGRADCEAHPFTLATAKKHAFAAAGACLEECDTEFWRDTIVARPVWNEVFARMIVSLKAA